MNGEEQDTLDMAAARELVRSPLWPHVRDAFRATGTFCLYPKGDLRRLEYVDAETRRQIDLWLEGIAKIGEWRTVVEGARVRALKAAYPGVYPEVLRYAAYFAGRADCRLQLLKLKFPEVYKICFC